MKKLLIFALFATGLIMTSCGSDNGPEITVTSPNSGTAYDTGDTMTLSGTVTDDVEVSAIALSGAINGTFDLTNITDRTNVSFNQDVVIDSTLVTGSYTFDITATDDEGNTDVATVEFSVN